MKKYTTLSALLIMTYIVTKPAIAIEIPDMHLQTDAKDATLIKPGDKEESPLNVFVNTLLGKNIDSVPDQATDRE